MSKLTKEQAAMQALKYARSMIYLGLQPNTKVPTDLKDVYSFLDNAIKEIEHENR